MDRFQTERKNGGVVIKASNITAGYKENTVIENINLEIEQGKIYSIIGPNGCGKSTLIKSLSRNIKISSGKIELFGSDIKTLSQKSIAQYMAVLSQHNNDMGEITVNDLVRYGRFAFKSWWKSSSDKDEEIVEWAMERAAISHLKDRELSALSGGERQRAWIAMSLAQKPSVLLLDEPTTYLDISHQLEVLELVKSLNKEENITIAMVLHDINQAARYSDEIIVVHKKGVYRKGLPDEVIEQGLMKDVFRVTGNFEKDSQTSSVRFFPQEVLR